MTNNYNQAFKKNSYLFLAFTGFLLSSGSYGSPLSSEEDSIKERLNLSSNGNSIAEDLERKPRYAFEGVRITDDEVQKDIKQPPQGKSSLKNQAKKAAKKAAAQAAKEKAYSWSVNKEEAEAIISSIMKGKRIKSKKDNTYYLAQNSAMNAAKEAAYESAFNMLHDEHQAEAIVTKLKLDHYAKKGNKNGGEAIRPDSASSKVTTLHDLKLDQSKAPKKKQAFSKLEKAKTGTRIGVKILEGLLKVGEFISKVIK